MLSGGFIFLVGMLITKKKRSRAKPGPSGRNRLYMC